MALTAGDVRTQLQAEFRKAPLPDSVYYRWENRFNKRIYEELYHIFPEKYLTTADITAIFSVALTGVSGTYTVGETVTEATSGYTGTVQSYSSGTLVIDDLSGAFTAGRVITGGTSSATGTSSSITEIYAHPLPSDFEDILPLGAGLVQLDTNNAVIREFGQTSYGSLNEGYYLTGENLVLTPEKPLSVTYTFRYIPTIADIAASDDVLIFPDRQIEEMYEMNLSFLRQMYELREERPDSLIMRQNQLLEDAAGQIRKMFKTSRKTLVIRSTNELLGMPSTYNRSRRVFNI
jgi:hypothetical protein